MYFNIINDHIRSDLTRETCLYESIVAQRCVARDPLHFLLLGLEWRRGPEKLLLLILRLIIILMLIIIHITDLY